MLKCSTCCHVPGASDSHSPSCFPSTTVYSLTDDTADVWKLAKSWRRWHLETKHSRLLQQWLEKYDHQRLTATAKENSHLIVPSHDWSMCYLSSQLQSSHSKTQHDVFWNPYGVNVCWLNSWKTFCWTRRVTLRLPTLVCAKRRCSLEPVQRPSAELQSILLLRYVRTRFDSVYTC